MSKRTRHPQSPDAPPVTLGVPDAPPILQMGTMTRRQLLEIWQTLDKIVDKGSDKDIRYAYGIAKNRGVLRPEIEALEEARKPPESYEAFERERLDLCRNYAKRNPETGEPLTYDEGKRFAIDPSKQEEFEAHAKKLREKHQEAVGEYEGILKDFEEFLDEEVTAPAWHPVALDLFPADTTPRTLETLAPIIRPPRDDAPSSPPPPPSHIRRR